MQASSQQSMQANSKQSMQANSQQSMQANSKQSMQANSQQLMPSERTVDTCAVRWTREHTNPCAKAGAARSINSLCGLACRWSLNHPQGTQPLAPCTSHPLPHTLATAIEQKSSRPEDVRRTQTHNAHCHIEKVADTAKEAAKKVHQNV